MMIQVLGTGCYKCKQLEENAKQAVAELGLKDTKVEHIYDINKIAERGVMITPALMVNGGIVMAGEMPSVEEIKEILQRKLEEEPYV